MNGRNPARSRPLSANVKRLMKMARESPQNPEVQCIERKFTERDLTYCDMQGQIFMAAVDRGLNMETFAPVYMNSQFAGVMDHSFSCSGGMETDDVSQLLKVPLLLKSPRTIVDVVMWLDNIVSRMNPEDSANMAVIEACMADAAREAGCPGDTHSAEEMQNTEAMTETQWADQYEYAYWLGYIYRCECLLHEESSRMVYGAFSEEFMRQTYAQLQEGIRNESLTACAGEICRRIDMLLIGKLWK